MRWLIALLLVLLFYMQYELWLGDGGIRENRALKNEIAAQRAENEHLRKQNDRLVAEIQDLKTGLEGVEERARNDLGLIKQGETYFQMVDEPPADRRKP